jgi:hypothetical protein
LVGYKNEKRQKKEAKEKKRKKEKESQREDTMKRVALVAVATVALQVLLCVVVRLPVQVAGQIAEDPQFNVSKIESFFNSSGRLPSTQPHTNNWAVLVRLLHSYPLLCSH